MSNLAATLAGFFLRNLPLRIRLILFDFVVLAIPLLFLGRAYWSFDYFRDQYTTLKPVVEILQQEKQKRVALPEAYQSTVKLFLDSNLKPILYDPKTVSPQFFSFHKVEYAVLDSEIVDQRVIKYSKKRESLSSTLFLADMHLGRSRVSVLHPGQNIAIEYSRPFVYSPIYESKPVKEIKRKFSFQLEPGEYEIYLQVWSRPRASIGVKLSINNQVSELPFRVTPHIVGPVRFQFSVESQQLEIARVVVELLRQQESDNVYLNHFQLRRLS